MGFPMPKTQSGYSRDEVISALQKDIRRGNEELAMFWALELVPQFEQYLWRRLQVIVQEDIGLAAPELLLLLPQQRELWFEFRAEGRDGPCRLILANAILAMCRAPKTRLADHFQCVINQKRLHGWRPDVPDYALDRHTRKGKAMGRGVQHWREEGCQLSPVAPMAELPDPYADTAYAFWANAFIDTKWPSPSGRAAGGGAGKGKSKSGGNEQQMGLLFGDQDQEQQED